MLRTLLELLLSPVLVGISTLVGRRWGMRMGGLVSAFPAVVGPVLLVSAQQRGARFAELAANGTLLGLVALSGFAVVYAWAAARTSWGVSLVAGWTGAAGLSVLVGTLGARLGPPVGLLAAGISLPLAWRVLPRPAPRDGLPEPRHPRLELCSRMLLTAILVVLLTLAARAVGPLLGGMAAALPVLASILVVFTHRLRGPDAVALLLRGMLIGMAGFVGFCAVVMMLVVPTGITVAFGAALFTAVACQALSLDGGLRQANG